MYDINVSYQRTPSDADGKHLQIVLRLDAQKIVIRQLIEMTVIARCQIARQRLRANSVASWLRAATGDGADAKDTFTDSTPIDVSVEFERELNRFVNREYQILVDRQIYQSLDEIVPINIGTEVQFRPLCAAES